MKIFNYLFYIILFLGFFLPTNTNMYLPISKIQLKVSEAAFILLPILNLLCVSKRSSFKPKRKIRKIIYFFLLLVFLTEFLIKPFIFDLSLGDALKSFRIGLPLYSSLVILIIGIKADIRIVWRVFLYAIGISVMLSLLSIIFPLPIYYGMEDDALLQYFKGRIPNSNVAFGFWGIYLLFKDKDKWYNKGSLVKIVSILSLIAIIVAFNRTFLALLLLEILYLVYITFSMKVFIKTVFLMISFAFIVAFAYNSNYQIQRQLDKRVFNVLNGTTSFTDNMIENNRDVIYEGVWDKVERGYWVCGLPYDVPIFVRKWRYNSDRIPMAVTDTSSITILMRVGIIPLILITLFFIKLFKSGSLMLRLPLFLLLIASLNIDALYRQNSIFFTILVYIITTLYHEKSLLHSKNGFK